MSGIIQVKLLGGFGNQLHQYSAVRKYAQLVDAKLEVETRDWYGAEIFGLNDPAWSCTLPEVNDGGGGPPSLEWGQTNIRIGGYFQFQRWVGLLSRAEVRSWFRVKPELAVMCPHVGGYTAVHVRQGDYIDHPLFANISERSYEYAIGKYAPPRPVVWVKQNHPTLVPGIPQRISFLPDFLTLLHATALLRANSTFSWWAATLSDADVYAPLVEDRVGQCDVEFVHGNWPRCADTNRVGVQVEDLYIGP